MRKQDYFKSLEECSKEIGPGDDVSEYDTMLAISRMEEEFTMEDLSQEIHRIRVDKALSRLVDLGLIDASWDEKAGGIVYHVKP